jgi:hypothetical protein
VHDPALDEALQAFGRPLGTLPARPIVHAAAGTLLTFAVAQTGHPGYVAGAWVRSDGVRFFGDGAPPTGPSAAHHLEGNAGALFDRWLEGSRALYEALESIDERLSDQEAHGALVRSKELWQLQRETARLRAQFGRAMITASEAAGPLAASFPGLRDALPFLLGELNRGMALSAEVQQAVSDIILLQNARESNRIAEAANRLSATSNRIAELANISNIRMLGLTYIALILGLVSAVVLIPNTAATILGMPSAGWVPGYWVDLILVVLALVPFSLVFTRPWVLRLLRGLADSETRAREGLQDLPEHVAGAPTMPRAGGSALPPGR